MLLRTSRIVWAAAFILAGVAPVNGYAARTAGSGAEPPVPGVFRTDVPQTEIVPRTSARVSPLQRAAAVGETSYVFSANLENLTSPNSENG
jgi:hypothetical protein